MFKVHLAEGYPLLSVTLKMILEAQPNVMVSGRSASIAQLQNQLSKDTSCLVLDYDLLKTDLLSFCRNLSKTFPELRIMVLFSTLQNIRLQHVFNYGIYAIIMKSVTADEFLQAFCKIQEGQYYIHEEIQRQVNVHFFARPGHEHLVKLSSREKEVLQLIVEECTTGEIAKRLYLSEGTIETHRLNILRKLGVRNTAGIVREAFLQHLLPGSL
jgi:DNA-binding NarL/FixJ family response regulator